MAEPRSCDAHNNTCCLSAFAVPLVTSSVCTTASRHALRSCSHSWTQQCAAVCPCMLALKHGQEAEAQRQAGCSGAPDQAADSLKVGFPAGPGRSAPFPSCSPAGRQWRAGSCPRCPRPKERSSLSEHSAQRGACAPWPSTQYTRNRRPARHVLQASVRSRSRAQAGLRRLLWAVKASPGVANAARGGCLACGQAVHRCLVACVCNRAHRSAPVASKSPVLPDPEHEGSDTWAKAGAQ